LIIARRFDIDSIGYFALSDITATTAHGTTHGWIFRMNLLSTYSLTYPLIDKWLDLDRNLKEQGVCDRSKLMLKVKYFKLPQYSLDIKSNHYYFVQVSFKSFDKFAEQI